MKGFFVRVHPLVDVAPLMSGWSKEFEEKWMTNKLPGWRINTSASNLGNQPLRLGMFNSAEELESLGTNRLKDALNAMGLKCGGTISEQALRLWSVRGKKAEDIPMKFRSKSSSDSHRNQSLDAHHEVCTNRWCTY